MYSIPERSEGMQLHRLRFDIVLQHSTNSHSLIHSRVLVGHNHASLQPLPSRPLGNLPSRSLRAVRFTAQHVTHATHTLAFLELQHTALRAD